MSRPADALRVAVDIGGTFTDCTVIDGDGRVITGKAPSTPADPAAGALASLERAAALLGLHPHALLARTTAFVHGCTVTTNAIVTRSGVPTGLLTTRGFRDTLTIGRVYQKAAGLAPAAVVHAARLGKPDPPIIEPSAIREVSERVDRTGRVLMPLDRDELEERADELVRDGAQALAVCFLWSFINPAHEREARDVLERAFPGVHLSVSSELVPLLGEYERTVTTVLDAYVAPRLTSYLSELEERLAALGYRGPLHVMHAAGGVTSAADARRRPITTVDSGPTGGTLGARAVGRARAEPNLICADVGGTTFDVSLIAGGDVELDRAPVISQYTLQLPKVAVRSVGAGGGSIAWIDDDGMLRVGPQSAGATPGPVAYGRGGRRPTVTDAIVMLGFLSAPGLDRAAAARALAELGEPLELDAVQVARGIFRIANAQMADLVRRCVIERGHDPRDFTLVAYGGAGPTHAAHYAGEAGIERIVVPAQAAVFSSFGMLTSELTRSVELSRRYDLPLSPAAERELDDALRELGTTAAGANGGGAHAVRVGVSAKFRMQAHTLALTLPDDDAPPRSARLERLFVERYEALYGPETVIPGAPIEITSLRVDVAQALPVHATGALADANGTPAPRKGERAVHWDDGAAAATPVIDGDRLLAGHRLRGPVLVERRHDTTVLPPGHAALVDRAGNLVIERA
jgi:N-methylhydantoinase A